MDLALTYVPAMYHLVNGRMAAPWLFVLLGPRPSLCPDSRSSATGALALEQFLFNWRLGLANGQRQPWGRATRVPAA